MVHKSKSKSKRAYPSRPGHPSANPPKARAQAAIAKGKSLKAAGQAKAQASIAKGEARKAANIAKAQSAVTNRPAAPSGLLRPLPAQASPTAVAARQAALARFQGGQIGIPPGPIENPPVRGTPPKKPVAFAKGGSAKRGRSRGR